MLYIMSKVIHETALTLNTIARASVTQTVQ